MNQTTGFTFLDPSYQILMVADHITYDGICVMANALAEAVVAATKEHHLSEKYLLAFNSLFEEDQETHEYFAGLQLMEWNIRISIDAPLVNFELLTMKQQRIILTDVIAWQFVEMMEINDERGNDTISSIIRYLPRWAQDNVSIIAARVYSQHNIEYCQDEPAFGFTNDHWVDFIPEKHPFSSN